MPQVTAYADELARSSEQVIFDALKKNGMTVNFAPDEDMVAAWEVMKDMSTNQSVIKSAAPTRLNL